VYDRRGDPQRALGLYPRAIELLVATLGEDHMNVAATIENAGRAHEHAGEFAEAGRHADRALAICSRTDCRAAQRATVTALSARAQWHAPGQRDASIERMQAARTLALEIPARSRPQVLAEIDAWLAVHGGGDP